MLDALHLCVPDLRHHPLCHRGDSWHHHSVVLYTETLPSTPCSTRRLACTGSLLWILRALFAAAAELFQSCPTLCNPINCSPPGSSLHGDSPGKNTGADYHSLLQGIFLTQWSNLDFLHCSGFFTTSATWRRRQWHRTPALLTGKSHGWRSFVGCSPWGR